jgi:Asp-tRNA(Asn)/Glu-tRNA(Gln) amidotransferase A subunit family amidase
MPRNFGLCAITMPVGLDRAGMPVGLQLTAPAHAEEKLLTIALTAERVLGTGADLWLPKIASGLAQMPRWAILASG